MSLALLVRPPVALAVGVWIAAVLAGFARLVEYQLSEGTSGFPARLPAEAAALVDPTRSTLFVFAHPRCSCTHATAGELARIMSACRGHLEAHVFLYRPLDAPDGWERTGLRAAFERIPAVVVRNDPGGRLARAFGAVSSGQTYLYDGAGELLFFGGITDLHGSSGDSRGQRLVVEGVLSGGVSSLSAPASGCPLLDPEPVR